MLNEFQTPFHLDCNPFENGARHLAVRSAQVEIVERGTRPRIPVRRAAALEVRQQQQAIGARRNGGGCVLGNGTG